DAELLERKTGVAAAIIELDALPDPVRPAAQYDNPLRARSFRWQLVFIFVSGVVVRRVSFEFRGAGIDRFECRSNTAPQPLGSEFRLGHVKDASNLAIRKPLPLCGAK